MANSPWIDPDTGKQFNYGSSSKGNINPFDAAGLGSMAGGAAYSFFGNPKSPMKEANKYLDQVPGQLHPYYDPYINMGQQTMPTLQNQFEGLINNPSALMSKIGGGYEQSPGYEWQMNQAMQAAGNAAAAGGMQGSPQHQQQAATVASGLANQDYYNYIDRAMKEYMTGLEGESGLNQMGYGASTDLGQMLASLMMNKGQLAYEGTAAKNKQEEEGWSGLGGALGGAAALALLL